MTAAPSRGTWGHPGRAHRAELNYEAARGAAAIGCTLDEIAVVLGVASSTLFLHLDHDEQLRDAIDAGRFEGATTLRRLQWQRAQKGDTTMLIWLGKQLLGQRDRFDVQPGDGAMKVLADKFRATLAQIEALTDAPGVTTEMDPAEAPSDPAQILDQPPQVQSGNGGSA